MPPSYGQSNGVGPYPGSTESYRNKARMSQPEAQQVCNRTICKQEYNMKVNIECHRLEKW